MREYLTVRANGLVDLTADEIVISFAGPRGGTRATEAISVDSAEQLLRGLFRVLAVMGRADIVQRMAEDALRGEHKDD